MGFAQRHSESAPAHSEVRPSAFPGGVEEPGASRLANAVSMLRALEDDIVAVLADADQMLHALQVKRVHTDAGFDTFADLEVRLLRAAPLLRAMRDAVPREDVAPPGSRRRRGTARCVDSDDRARRIKGLATISQAIAHLRSLDERLRRLADAARGGLAEIESEGLYDECGYSSLEDFFERALAPSPVLSAACAILADEPLPERASPSEPQVPASSENVVSFRDVSLLESASTPVNDFTAEPDAVVQPGESPGVAPEQVAGPPTLRPRGLALVSVGLALVAAIGGGVAGIFLS
jgi:hypothetical protein